MRENNSDKTSSDSQVGNAEQHFIKSADSFFHKPAGVFLICFLFFGLTVWAFVPVLQTGFQIYDESPELIINTHVNTGLTWQNLRWALFSQEYSNWYPLTWISHMLDCEMFGGNPRGHHLTNVLLHATNGVLLFLILKRMTGALWRSLIVAALFALHPLRVESVAWITERKDVLSAFFGLLALWTYALFAKESITQGGRPKLFYGFTLLFFAFGLMSKSMLVTFPCLLLLLDYWPLERWRQNGKWNLVLEKVPFFLLVLPVSIITCFAQKGGGMFMLHFPLSFRLETAFMGYARYLGKMFWPTNFSVLYPYPDYWPVGQLLCAAAIILGMSVVAFALRQRRPYLLVGWLWYVGTLVPVIGLITLGAQSMSNRYTYIPMIGILVLVVWTINDLSKQRRRRIIPVMAVVALMMCVCISRTRGEIVYWKNSETLWNRAIATTKNNFGAHFCLANILWVAKSDEAVAELQKSLAIYPDFFDGQVDLAVLLFAGGHISDCVVHYEKAIQIKPDSSWAYNGLGQAHLKLNRASDAVPLLLKAVEIEPHNARYKDDLFSALYSGSLKTEAVSSFLATVQLDTNGFDRFFEAVQADTNRVGLINNMAWVFATDPDPKLRNGKFAVRLAARACELTGFQSGINVMTLAAAYAEDSRFDDAVASAQLACSLASAAGQSELLKGNQYLLELFHSHQPYHEPIKASSP